MTGKVPPGADPATIKALEQVFNKLGKVARETGALYSGGAALTSASEANAFGQTCFGPVVLVVDAVTCCAGDIFAAGFQDHGIGPVLGTDRQTGGGGANVWPHDFLVRILPDVPEIRPLPGGAKLRVAARRCVRTGSFDGLPIEELGVRADKLHRITEADLLEDNRDLEAAGLARHRRRRAGQRRRARSLAGREPGDPELRSERAEGAPPARPGSTTDGMTTFDGMRPWRLGSFAAS